MLEAAYFHQLVHSSHQISAVLSLFFNILLIFIILRKSPPQLGVYKYMMAFTSLFEIIFSILDAECKMVDYAYRTAAMTMIRNEDTHFSPLGVLIAQIMYWGLFGAAMAIFSIHFVYRYLAVTHNSRLDTFNSWKLVFWLMIPIATGLTWSLTSCFLYYHSQSALEFIREEFELTFGESIENYNIVPLFPYQINENGSFEIHYEGIIGISVVNSSVCISLSIILFFGIRCYLNIQRIHKMSTISTLNSLQRQLFYALVVQTAIPLICLLLPTALICGFALIDKGPGLNSAFGSIANALYPVLDPLPNFIIINPYRKALFGYLRCGKGISPISQYGIEARTAQLT